MLVKAEPLELRVFGPWALDLGPSGILSLTIDLFQICLFALDVSSKISLEAGIGLYAKFAAECECRKCFSLAKSGFPRGFCFCCSLIFDLLSLTERHWATERERERLQTLWPFFSMLDFVCLEFKRSELSMPCALWRVGFRSRELCVYWIPNISISETLNGRCHRSLSLEVDQTSLFSGP